MRCALFTRELPILFSFNKTDTSPRDFVCFVLLKRVITLDFNFHPQIPKHNVCYYRTRILHSFVLPSVNLYFPRITNQKEKRRISIPPPPLRPPLLLNRLHALPSTLQLLLEQPDPVVARAHGQHVSA